MTDRNVIYAGAQMRALMLGMYQSLGPAKGCEITRRYLYELGEVLCEMHGREQAASLLYNVADAVTCKLPIEDFRLPPRSMDGQ